MSDDWEDWENEHFTISEEKLKRLKEIRLVEESDNSLTRNLFSNEEDLVGKEVKQKKIINKTCGKGQNTSSKQKENEEKQKQISKKNKEEKNIKKREIELFGEADEDNEYNEYTKYEYIFY
jgi:hypothetical protein